ncbi:succinate dehydrogenase, cytochrome b556 subunit [Mangrovicoccus algicola]|uniref:Succinate dehydrogenase cytochrome b556 subunit n=1 Tax=Mangrovicoccus algicola TaxID=2771008 RepID=A0A8J6YSG9_9RHOB|nr:succinate dehydrogenase, cytochrome b556 subunit [Mangrovicoccus algicola]MBE3636685.1 succinate dehydrogenase, cytochrome b556 subunit [Mangrovicoccus algicola]
MADVNRGNRPLSPFMIGQYYRPQITSVSSIMVRITGIALLCLSILPVAWLLAASGSGSAFAGWDGFLRSWFGYLIMLGALWAMFYHLLGRLRHVIWDLGYGLDLEISRKMGMGMFVLATVLTVLVVLGFLIF